ncbi:MAG: hypothetical protein SVT52_02125 [Planctomycetota bacterium]|nr:hypothetical protein [Planctomycetota bacterium]
MSARLLQPGQEAPVSLRLDGEVAEAATAVRASCNFANVKLEPLDLPELLNLPLRKLNGQCSGSIDLQLNRQGKVDRFGFNLTAARLDVQPTAGPKLPVFEQAHVRLAAACDLFSPGGGRIEVPSVSLHLPGMDLTGQAVLSADILTGNWKAIQSLEMHGVVRPMRLAALLTGRPSLPGQLAVDGSLRVHLGVKRQRPQMRLVTAIDGTGATISRAKSVLKPLHKDLRAELEAVIDERNWEFRIEQSSLVLGLNRLMGRGTIRDIRTPLRRWAGAEGPPTLRMVLEDLAQVNWQGSWSICELDSLRDLHPNLAWLLDGATLRGVATGRWLLDQRNGMRIHASARLPEQAHLAIGRFVKPAKTPISLELSAAIDAGKPALGDIDAVLTVGPGRLHVAQGRINLRDDDKPIAVDADGRFAVERIETLLDVLGDSDRWPVGLCGSMRGEYAIRLDSDAAGAAQAEAHLLVDEARCQVRPGPTLVDSLGDCNLSGSLQADLWSRWQPGKLEADLRLDGGELDCVFDGPTRRLKPAGVPLRFQIAGCLNSNGENQTLELRTLAMDLAQNSLHLSGTATFNPSVRPVQGKLWPPGLQSFRADVNSACVPGEALERLWPEMMAAARACGASGELKAETRIRGDTESIRLESDLDADNLAVMVPSVLAKAVGMNAKVKVEATVPVDLSRIHVNNLRATVGDVHLLAAGAVTMARSQDAHRATPANTLHLVAWTACAETLHSLAPALKPYALSGDGMLEMEWSDDEAGWRKYLQPQTGTPLGRIKVLEFHADRLRGRYRGKDVALCGDVLFRNIALEAGAPPAPQGVKSNLLELRAGDNHLWLVAELGKLTTKPTGTFHLFGAYLDDKDLADWLSEPSDQPTSRPKKLTTKEVEKLQKFADNAIARVRPLLAEASVDGRVSIDHFKTFDASVEQIYDARHVELAASAVDGQIQAHYTASLNGGTLRRRYRINLTEPNPSISCRAEMRDLIAAENIRPQIARFFPGNTVEGLFNRTEDITVSLRDVVAQVMDQRYHVHPVGTARTRAIEGLVTGRGAPKFVTRIFPGLNLAKYRYNTMTGFAEFKPDGNTDNDMIFSGQVYDIYIEGTTDAENIGRYTIGLILLGTPQTPQWNHAWKQGRIPILKFKARIEDGKLYDEEVSYPWPNETLGEILLKNNIFYRLWVNVQKQKK